MQQINLEKLHVQLVNNASGLNWGKNLQISTKTVTKTNQGCGAVGGDGNLIPTNLNSVNDGDILDSLVQWIPANSRQEPDNNQSPQVK